MRKTNQQVELQIDELKITIKVKVNHNKKTNFVTLNVEKSINQQVKSFIDGQLFYKGKKIVDEDTCDKLDICYNSELMFLVNENLNLQSTSWWRARKIE